MRESLKRIILILFLMIYIAILTHITGCSINDKCHYRDGEEDPISIEMSNIISKEKINNKLSGI